MVNTSPQIILWAALTVFLIGIFGGLYFLGRYFRYLSGLKPSAPGTQSSITRPNGIYFYLFLAIQALALTGLLFALIFLRSNGNSGTTYSLTKSTGTATRLSTADYISPEGRAISQEVESKDLQRMLIFNKGVLATSDLFNIFRGIIENIEYHEQSKNLDIKLHILLRGSEGYTNDFLFNANDIQNSKILGKDKKPMDIKNLKKGDKISITMQVDLLKDPPNNRHDLTITKYNK